MTTAKTVIIDGVWVSGYAQTKALKDVHQKRRNRNGLDGASHKYLCVTNDGMVYLFQDWEPHERTYFTQCKVVVDLSNCLTKNEMYAEIQWAARGANPTPINAHSYKAPCELPTFAEQ